MIPIARRMIWREKARFFITAAGLGLTAMLMMFLLGVYEGVKRGSTGYVEANRADIWVCESNSTNLLRSSSFLPIALGEEFKKSEGVQDTAGVLRVLASTKIKGRPVTLFLFGFDPREPLGKPSRINRGSATIGPVAGTGTMIYLRSGGLAWRSPRILVSILQSILQAMLE